jgi:hypothetical protein
MAAVGELAWFYNPYVLSLCELLRQSLLFVVLKKFLVLWIFSASCNVKCQWQRVKYILTSDFVVFSHTVKHGFFIYNKVVKVKVILHLQLNWCLYFKCILFSEQRCSFYIYLFL